MQVQGGLPNWQLFVIAVVIWSTTWHAILYQLEVNSPEAGVALRFALAGVVAVGIAAWRGDRLRCTAAEHGRIALQGIFMYSLAYLCVYHAERHVPSGLVAVAYSASPLVTGIGAWLLWRSTLTPRFIVGGLLCLVGVAMVFAPEFARVRASDATLRGTLFTLGAVLLSGAGSLLASRNAKHRLPFWPTIGLGMLYSAVLSAVVLWASGQPLVLPSPLAAPAWWLSLAYLAIAGSVVAFACYLTLQQRIARCCIDRRGHDALCRARGISCAGGVSPGRTDLVGRRTGAAGQPADPAAPPWHRGILARAAPGGRPANGIAAPTIRGPVP